MNLAKYRSRTIRKEFDFRRWSTTLWYNCLPQLSELVDSSFAKKSHVIFTMLQLLLRKYSTWFLKKVGDIWRKKAFSNSLSVKPALSTNKREVSPADNPTKSFIHPCHRFRWDLMAYFTIVDTTMCGII